MWSRRLITSCAGLLRGVISGHNAGSLVALMLAWELLPGDVRGAGVSVGAKIMLNHERLSNGNFRGISPEFPSAHVVCAE